MSDQAFWTIHVLWGAKIYRDAPENIRERLEGRYPTYNGAADAATLVTQWARIPLGRAKITYHSPFLDTLRATKSINQRY